MFTLTGHHWFDSEVRSIHDAILRHGNTPAFEGLLASLVEQVYRTRADFRDEMAALMTIIVAIFTAGGVLLNQGIEQWGNSPIRPVIFFSLAFIVFAAIHPLGLLYRARLSAAYDIYVAACIHCVMYYFAFNLPLTHLWQRNVIECLKHAKGTFNSRRNAGTAHHSWQWHREFTPHPKGRHPGEYGELVQAWKERRPNLSTSLKNTILVARIAGTLFAIVCAALITLSLRLPPQTLAADAKQPNSHGLADASTDQPEPQ